MKKTLLLVYAHPDDEVLACFGTVARLIQEGCEAYTLILGEGVTSRDDKRNPDARQQELKKLKNEIVKANEVIGIKEVFTCDLPDNRFDNVDLLDVVKEVEKIKNKIKPSIIFTHSQHDLNIDHQITYRAVLTATRPIHGETVKEIYAGEILSSSEWNYPLKFSPNVYFNIESTIELKVKAMAEYQNELREYPHPRSLEGIRIKAKQRGLEVGCAFAEAFELIRSLR